MCVCAGVRTLPVVSECKCVGGCIRLPHYQQFTVPVDRGTHGEGEGEGEAEAGEMGSGAWGQSQMEGHQRMVDVGRCAGSCPERDPECIR